MMGIIKIKIKRSKIHLMWIFKQYTGIIYMKKILLLLTFLTLPTFSYATCNSYMIDNYGDGEVIKSFRSRGIIFSCYRVAKKCRRALEFSQEDAVCINSRVFKWKMVTEVSHDLDKASKRLHRDLENILGDHGENQQSEIKLLIQMAHELSESSRELHEAVEKFRVQSRDTKTEYNKVKFYIKKINESFIHDQFSHQTVELHLEIKQLFKDLRRFY